MTRLITLAFGLIAVTALAGSPPIAERLTHGIYLERIDFNEATLQEALGYLNQKANEHLGGNEKIELRTTAPSRVRLSFSYKGISLFDLLEEISRQTGLVLHARGRTLSLHVQGVESPVAKSKRHSEEANIYEATLRYITGNEVGNHAPTGSFDAIRWLGPAKVRVSNEDWGFELTHTTRGWFVTGETQLVIE